MLPIFNVILILRFCDFVLLTRPEHLFNCFGLYFQTKLRTSANISTLLLVTNF
jgi:hypothetical protein